MSENNFKKCSKCEEEKMLNEFYIYVDKSGNMRYRGDCKACFKNVIKEKYKQNNAHRKRREAFTSRFSKEDCINILKLLSDNSIKKKAIAEKYGISKELFSYYTRNNTFAKALQQHYNDVSNCDVSQLRVENPDIVFNTDSSVEELKNQNNN